MVRQFKEKGGYVFDIQQYILLKKHCVISMKAPESKSKCLLAFKRIPLHTEISKSFVFVGLLCMVWASSPQGSDVYLLYGNF